MIVIAIIGILVAVALPQFTSMTEDAKKAKAKSDTAAIGKAIARFNAQEGVMCKSLSELRGKYLSNIDTLRDPWGQSYDYDAIYGIVYSKGPDGKHSSHKDATWNDDTIVDIYANLVLIAAELEDDPDPNTDENTAYDRLYLRFNKAVMVREQFIVLDSTTAASKDMDSIASGNDADALDGKIFRWYLTRRSGFSSGVSPFPDNMSALIRRTDDPRDVVLVFPPGMTGILETSVWLNLTGTKKDSNPFFRAIDETKGAVATGAPVQIEGFSGGGIEVDEEVAAMVEAAAIGELPREKRNVHLKR